MLICSKCGFVTYSSECEECGSTDLTSNVEYLATDADSIAEFVSE